MGNQLWKRYSRSTSGCLGLALLALILFFTLFGPSLSNHSHDAIHLAQKNQSPSSDYWFGTDDLGRDLFTRTWYGARISLLVGLSAACIDLLIGLVWGSIAGFFGGKVDEVMMRLADILYSLPYMLVVILLSVVLGSGIVSILIAITLFGWMTMARIVRGQTMLLKEMDYVLAAKALGAGSFRILFKHLLPNAIGPVLVTLTMTVPSAIFAEAFLSFLGLGIQAPMASWGTMANEGLPAMQFYPWRLFIPAFFISLTLLTFNLIGEALKKAFFKSEQMSLT
jgi:oligopeptide transport system permease protein